MKNLWIIGVLLFFSIACTEQLQEEARKVVDASEHPEYVLDAVNKYLPDGEVKETFLASIEYDTGLYIVDVDFTVLDNLSFSSDELLAFCIDLFGAKLTVISNDSGIESRACDGRSPQKRVCFLVPNSSCLCRCTNNSRSPAYPSGPCTRSGGSCTEWYWLC